jgi:acetyl-CoA acetyltransferase
MKLNERVAAVGVGYSTTGRNTGLSSWQLGIQAAKAALADAGMTPSDLDGVTLLWGVAGPAPPGLDMVESQDFGRVMGISPLNWHGSGGLPAYIGPALEAIAAIRAGFAHTVLTLRIINQRLSSTGEINELRTRTGPTFAPGDSAFTAPYGFGVAGIVPSIAAMPAQRHMDVFGTTEEQFGAHVVAQRWHATMNDDAIFREPLTIEDYLASRYIAKPVHLLDCDYPVDSASAVIYTAGDRGRDWRKKPVWVEAAASSSVSGFSFDTIDMNHNSPFHAAAELWKRTDLRPGDVDCAQLYDGFTIIVFQWLEALGFCNLGEAGPFVEAGHTRLGGTIPVNTDGGACNVGRRHGANFCIESVRQLRGECGERQVADAQVAVWSNAVGPFSGVVLMTADR